MSDRSGELPPASKAKRLVPPTELARRVRAATSPTELHERVQDAIAADDIWALDEASRNIKATAPTIDLLADSRHLRIVQGAAVASATSSATLDRIIGFGGKDIAHPELRDSNDWKWVLQRAATHHALRPTARRHLGRQAHPLVAGALASRLDLSDGELQDFSTRGAAARTWVAFQLSRDPERLPTVFAKLHDDPIDDVVGATRGVHPNDGLYKSWDFRRFLMGVYWRDRFPGIHHPLGAARTPLEERARAMSAHAGFDQIIDEIFTAGDARAALRLIQRWDLTAPFLDRFADFPSCTVIAAVARNLRTDESTLLRIAGAVGDIQFPALRLDADWNAVEHGLAVHARLHPTVRREIATRHDASLTLLVACRWDLSDDELVSFGSDGATVSVRAAAARILAADPERNPGLLADFVWETDPRIVAAVRGAAPDWASEGRASSSEVHR